MKRDKNYSKKYFEQRDHLDLLIAESLKILAKKNNYKSTLDVGCGTGQLVKFLNKNKFNAKGCDKIETAVEIAKKNNIKGTIKKAVANKLPYPDKSFDLVTSISVIEHLTKKEMSDFLKESKRVLRPKGTFFLITPNYNSPFRYIFGQKWFAYKDPTHINFFTTSSIKNALIKYGFKHVKFRHQTAYNLPFDWYLPSQLHGAPMPIKNLLNYLLISSPLATFRDSIWVTAQK